MKSLVVAASLAAVLCAAPVFAQAPAKPAAPTPAKPAAPTPAKPAAPTPSAQAEPAPSLQPPPAFPAGAKFAYVNLQAIAQLSAEGKVAAGKVQALTTTKSNDLAEKTKALQAAQQKLQSGAGVMNDQARAALEKEIERMTRELERLQQDAQVAVNELQSELQEAFQAKLVPVLEQIAKEKELHFLFSGADAGLIWVAPGLDLTVEAVTRLDAITTKKP